MYRQEKNESCISLMPRRKKSDFEAVSNVETLFFGKAARA